MREWNGMDMVNISSGKLQFDVDGVNRGSYRCCEVYVGKCEGEHNLCNLYFDLPKRSHPFVVLKNFKYFCLNLVFIRPFL